jgi:hypothetical protein
MFEDHDSARPSRLLFEVLDRLLMRPSEFGRLIATNVDAMKSDRIPGKGCRFNARSLLSAPLLGIAGRLRMKSITKPDHKRASV